MNGDSTAGRRERMDNEEVSVMEEESKEQKRPRQFMACIELVE